MKRVYSFAVFCLLMSLAAAFGPEAYAQSSRGLAIPGERLPRELAEMAPKDFFIPSTEKKVGVVHALEGSVVIIHGKTREAYFGAAGDEIYESDALTTLADSRCRVRFVDEDVVTMAAETEFSVESFEDQRSEGKKSSFFRMLKGKAMFYAMRLFRYRETRLTLATPTATIGVRGTKFGAHVYFENDKVAGGGVLVADAGNEIAPYLAQAGGGRSFTDCFSEDGVLNVNGQAVPPGQMYSGRTGQVIPTPPGVLQMFRLQTQIAGVGGGTSQGQASPGSGSEGGDSVPGGAPGSLIGTPAAVADIQSNLTSVVQLQTGKQTELVEEKKLLAKETKELTGPLYGYFSVLLIKGASSAGPFSVYDAFLSSDDSNNFYRPSETDPNLNTTAYAVVNTGGAGGGDYLKVTGSPAPDQGQARLEAVTDATDQIDIEWNKVYLGHNSYTQWGYWEAKEAADFTHLNGNYYRLVTDKIWFLEGNYVTKAADMPASGSYAYSGGAHGVYQGPTGGGYANLSGSFNCQVNFGSGSVQNFNLNVADTNGSNRVIITQSTDVTLNRNANGNSFSFNGSSGSASINMSAATFRVNGSVFGPQAQEIGGGWGAVNTGTGEGASGVFAGTKQ